MQCFWCKEALRCANTHWSYPSEFQTSFLIYHWLPSKLALTAASPIWRGYLADVDSRWNVIAGSVDDRTEEERGLKVSYFASERFAIITSFFSHWKRTNSEFQSHDMTVLIFIFQTTGWIDQSIMTTLYHMTKQFMTVYAPTVRYGNIIVKLMAQVCLTRNWWPAIQAYLSSLHSRSFSGIFGNHQSRWLLKQRSFRGISLRPSS